MKQVLQDLSSGTTSLLDCPAPKVRAGQLLIDTTVSLISTGTERMLVDFGRSGLIAKARAQPDKVRQVLAKARTDGVLTTVAAVRSKLNEAIPLGYCNVGRVREVGAGVGGFEAGDRVVSNGPHADVVAVPVNLCARIPDAVSDEAASFAVLASIGLQGVRLAAPTIGEAFVVTGVGTIGLLTVQLLRANGCRVLAIDFDSAKLALAAQFGAETCNPGAGEDAVAAGLAFSRGIGVDGVIITASTKSSDPVTQAAQMSRKRGRIVLVGVTGLELNRADFYEKELSFQVSCSYGPGRYDPAYEQGGHDYPVGFVRWTEQRNIAAVLDLMAAGRIDVAPLISRRVPFEQAPEAYDVLASDKSALGILLTYDHPADARHAAAVPLDPTPRTAAAAGKPVVGFIGAGNYASRVLIPAFKAAGASLHSIASAGGSSSAIHGRRAGFANATSDAAALVADPAISTVVVATRHDSHARFTADALAAGKHVFVEKPLALTRDELERVEQAHAASGRLLMVGFNRRFAPLTVRMKKLLAATAEPKSFVMVMNAGAIPADHWVHDPAVGGGRIVGEACHLIDLMRFLAGAPITSVAALGMGASDALAVTADKASIALGFADGSFGTIHYLANGGASFPKERVEVFVQGRTLLLDNFRTLRGFDWPGFRKQALWRQDKGQAACAAAFLDAVEHGGEAPIAAAELFEVARATIDAAEQLRRG
ncbi:bi-domain-containing oxidoreductase [Sphingomonas sp.]|uniref:bi-domain-containing oxidoreductase n=1 Tax=Sphingomonas sp. TaxID=28214 RepID=UPI00286D961F|nr:bi-domain-containing oxidoreductase [Sphingomonas sp.]